MPIRGVTEKPIYQGDVQQLTPKFWEMVDYAMQQSDSLGLEMGIHICDGFAFLACGLLLDPFGRRRYVLRVELSLILPALTLASVLYSAKRGW